MDLSSDLKLKLLYQKDQCFKVVLNTVYQRQYPNETKAQENSKKLIWESHGPLPSVTQQRKDRGKNIRLAISSCGKDPSREESKKSTQKPFESNTQMVLELVLFDSLTALKLNPD